MEIVLVETVLVGEPLYATQHELIVALFKTTMWTLKSIVPRGHKNSKRALKIAENWTYRSQTTGSDGVSFRLPQLFFSQHRLKKNKKKNRTIVLHYSSVLSHNPNYYSWKFYAKGCVMQCLMQPQKLGRKYQEERLCILYSRALEDTWGKQLACLV